jgi:hypothetical protein
MKYYIFLIFVFISFINSRSQSISPTVVNSSGTTYKANGIQLDWSLGELAITTISNQGQSISQGFLQTGLVFVSSDEPSEISVQVFPNPVTDYLTILVEENEVEELSILDQTGKILSTQKFLPVVSFQNLADGTYYVNLKNKEFKTLKTLKIIKL